MLSFGNTSFSLSIRTVKKKSTWKWNLKHILANVIGLTFVLTLGLTSRSLHVRGGMVIRCRLACARFDIRQSTLLEGRCLVSKSCWYSSPHPVCAHSSEKTTKLTELTEGAQTTYFRQGGKSTSLGHLPAHSLKSYRWTSREGVRGRAWWRQTGGMPVTRVNSNDTNVNKWLSGAHFRDLGYTSLCSSAKPNQSTVSQHLNKANRRSIISKILLVKILLFFFRHFFF